MGVSRTGWYYVALLLSLLIGAGLTILERRTYLGLVLKSIKHDEVSAGACGVAVFPVKLFAFSASALIAGFCGVLLAANLKFLTPDLFGTPASFRYLMMAVVGGIGSATGGMVAALLPTPCPSCCAASGDQRAPARLRDHAAVRVAVPADRHRRTHRSRQLRQRLR